MTLRDLSPCGHDAVAPAGLLPDLGGQVHEVGACVGCGAELRRRSPLDPWTPDEEED